MELSDKSTTGYWLVSDNEFKNQKFFKTKHLALEHATKLKHNVSFYFHNNIWESFDRTKLGKQNLTTLYSERARQLRDKYDYLVLHYSGGSDSHNVLHTFLTNNIKLDEISIRWPKHWLDGKFYDVNNVDTSAKNAPSEFNYTIKPTLEYLSKHHPNIKINIVDFTENLHILTNQDYIEKRILTINSSRSAMSSIVQRLDANTDRKMASVSKDNVGHIFGIEKPSLQYQDNNLYFYFSDVSFDTISMERGMNAEPFYWTSELPELAMEQIYQAGLFFKNNRQYLNLLNSPNKSTVQVTRDYNLQQNILKNILYKQSWDFSKFQVDKPNIDRSDWHSWIHDTPELTELNKIYDNAMSNITSGIDNRFLINTDKTPLFATFRTKLFQLMSLDD